MGKKQYNVRTAAVAATERRARRSGASVVAAGSGSSYNEVYGDIAGKLDRELFDSMFERVSEGVDAEGVERWYILAKSDLVGVGDVTAYGVGSPGGGGSTGGGVTELRSLDDVILTNPKAGHILKYDGQHWVNGTMDAGLNETALAAYLQTNRYAKLSDIPSLADYATRSWVEDKGYATQIWVEDKGYATEAWVTAQRYLTEHQDISHLLTRAEFEAMFERIDTDGGGWYILAKSHLASVGDVTAYGTGGPGSTLGGIGDVQLGSLAAGDVIKWDGQHWVNGPAPAGGIDESVLANYVTLDTEQEISGHKRFAHNDTDFSYRITLNGSFESDIHHFPQVMWHVYNRQWTKAVMDSAGNIHFLEGSVLSLESAHRGLVASKYVKFGGTASQVLMADGSVSSASGLIRTLGSASGNVLDTTLFVTSDNGGQTAAAPDYYRRPATCLWAYIQDKADSRYIYHRRVDSYTLNIDTDITGAGGLYEIKSPTGTFPYSSDWHKVFDWGATDNAYRVQLITSLVGNTSLYLRHKINGTWWSWRTLLDDVNYAGILDGRYVNKAGDTMTGPLRIAHSATGSVLYTQYNTAGAYSSFIWANVNESRILFGSPSWRTVELETAKSATAAYRRTNGVQYKIWDSGNHGSGSGLDADLLDGLHGGDYVGYRGLISSIGVLPATAGMYQIATAGWSGGVVVFNCYGSNSGLAFYRPGGSNSMPQILCALDSTNNWDNFGSIVTSRFGNAPSATKLQTARTLRTTSYNGYRASDGVSFDGTGDVTLKLPNSICASDWFRSYGSSGWYNQDYNGGIYMTDSAWVRIYNNKGFYSGSGEIRSDARFNRMGYGGSSWNNGQGAYNVAIYSNSNQTPLLLAYRDSAGLEATGADRLFAIELLNNGAELRFGFGGTTRFTFYSGGHLVVSGDVTAYSDARLKSDVQTLHNRGFIIPRTYIKDGKRCIGFLAQEVRQLYPELVTDTGGADHWLALNYGNLVAVLEAQIIDHEERIKRLEDRA